MSKLSEAFDSLSKEGSGAFIPYVCAGDPDSSFSVDLIEELCTAGADVVELGIPFSDPVADGPVIQKAMNRSLSAGFKCAHTFEIVSQVRKKGIRQPIVVMTYFNPVLQMGLENFCKSAARSGVGGILIVDLPPEESEDLDLAAKRSGLDLIRLVAPTTSDSRLDYILGKASGFVYIVSVAGTTGARDDLPESAVRLVRKVSSKSRVPVVLGFGISNPAQAKAAMGAGALGIVEGSKLISMYSEKVGDRKSMLSVVGNHVREMKGSIRNFATTVKSR